MSIWKRLAAAVRYVIAQEPAAVVAAFRALLVLLSATGLIVAEQVEARGVGIILAFYALVEVVGTLRVRARSTPNVAVVEKVNGDGVSVVAGPASELPTGQYVRELGSLDTR